MSQKFSLAIALMISKNGERSIWLALMRHDRIDSASEGCIWSGMYSGIVGAYVEGGSLYTGEFGFWSIQNWHGVNLDGIKCSLECHFPLTYLRRMFQFQC